MLYKSTFTYLLTKQSDIVRLHSLGERSERDVWVQQCEENDQVVTNILHSPPETSVDMDNM